MDLTVMFRRQTQGCSRAFRHEYGVSQHCKELERNVADGFLILDK